MLLHQLHVIIGCNLIGGLLGDYTCSLNLSGVQVSATQKLHREIES